MLCIGLSLKHVRLPSLFRQAATSQRRSLLTLAIETSCDDTCVAILEYNQNGVKLSENEVHSPIARLHFHEKVTAPNTGKGGIHPLEAANSHRANLGKILKRALGRTSLTSEPDGLPSKPFTHRPHFISVTRGPGMHSNLSCGLDTAKGLAAAFDVPLVGVHHMQAHALTPRLVNALQQTAVDDENIETAPAFPFLTLLVSGGHTMLLHSRSLTNHTMLANTMDIAIGDCLDKCGRSILPKSIKSTATDTAYGRHLSSYAFPDESTFPYYPAPAKRSDEIEKPLNEFGWRIQPPLGETRKLAFSYAGYTSHVHKIMSSKPEISDAERLILARTALGAAFEHLCSRTIMVLQSLRDQNIHIPTLVVSGGVAANDFLRYYLRQMLDVRGFDNVELAFPPIKISLPGTRAESLDPCTDNAAMIAWAGLEMFRAGWQSDESIDAIPRWSMDPEIDGGITGASGCSHKSELAQPKWTFVHESRRLEFFREQEKLNIGDQAARSEQAEKLWRLKKQIDMENEEQRARNFRENPKPGRVRKVRI